MSTNTGRISRLDRAQALGNYVAEVFRHPLNRGQFWKTAWRYVSWHLGSRLLGQPVLYPFANDLQMRIGKGMWGATSVVHMGLEEFEDMCFSAHLLRSGDLFVDVGANFGTYTLLASGVAGARCVSFEPNPTTRDAMLQNLHLNGLEDRVKVVAAAVGDEEKKVRLTDGYRAADHVLDADADARVASVEVDQVTLDQALEGQEPTLIKIDVEGYESKVVAGASRVLASESLLAVIVEDVGLGSRFGEDEGVHGRMRSHGFTSYEYDPSRRELRDLHGRANDRGRNTLYLRSTDEVTQRLRSADPIRIHGVSV